MGRGAGLAALLLVALVGCSSANSGSGTADMAAPAPAQKPGVAQEKSAQGQAEQAGTEAIAQNRQLVRTASVDLRTPDVSGVLTRVKDLAIGQGGFSAQENAQLSHASVTLRVPGDRLDAVLKSIGEIEGVEVARREVRTEDVTEQVVDIEARLANQRASVDRVRALLDRAGTTSEITQIESELTKRQSELESLQRRYDTLKGQVALSTLTVTIGSRGAAPVVEDRPDFLDALAGGWNALVDGFAWLLVIVGAVLPFAAVLAVPAAWYLVRRRRRKSAVTA